MTKQVEVLFLGRDRVVATFEFAGADIGAHVVSMSFRASGCSAFQDALQEFKDRVMALPAKTRLIDGSADFDSIVSSAPDHVSILVRELVLRARDQFQLPYTETELCHCRAVPTEVVDRAIISGCHSVQSVARATSAGTSCGTCKPDTESLIAYRLGKR